MDEVPAELIPNPWSWARRSAGPALFLIVALALLTAARGDSVLPLANAYGSPGALATAVLAELERSDVAALRAVALTEQEFADHVWPELPAARPERNLPLSYVWGDLRQKSESSLAQTLASRGGRHYELVNVRFAGPTTEYAGYKVHRRTELIVKDEDGVEQPLRFFGSMLEKQGSFKVFSYVVD